MSWTFHNPVSVIHGHNSLSNLAGLISDSEVLVVSTKRGRRQFERTCTYKHLSQKNKIYWYDSVTENPSIDSLDKAIHQLSSLTPSAIIGFGGGSAIDTAKILRVCIDLEFRHQVLDLVENPSICPKNCLKPLIAIPTTSGTGSEVTPFATCWDYKTNKKYSLSNSSIWPTIAIVDPILTYSAPRDVTISTGLDTINQAFESVWNKNSNPITLSYATHSLHLSLNAFPRLLRDTDDTQARDLMSEASLLAGLAISHTRTGICHSISYPLTATYHVPHGIACAFTMNAVLKHNTHLDDGRIANLASYVIPNGTCLQLISSVKDILQLSSVTQIVQEAVGSLENLIALEHQMFTPGRADNNFCKIDSLHQILLESWSEIP